MVVCGAPRFREGLLKVPRGGKARNNGNFSCKKEASRLTGQWRPAVATNPPYGVFDRSWALLRRRRASCERGVGREGWYDRVPKKPPQAQNLHYSLVACRDEILRLSGRPCVSWDRSCWLAFLTVGFNDLRDSLGPSSLGRNQWLVRQGDEFGRGAADAR